MSRIDYAWSSATPPAPDVYTTRRNQSTYITLRYWDGQSWWEIGGGSRGGKPFTWPKKSRSRKPWWLAKCTPIYLRKIGVHQGAIQWGEPFKVYDEKEVIAHLVKTGRLSPEWRTAYQAEMRSGVFK
jgi:hypothetical protein